MTTDAKIGLLLALIFIVAITFVINGLPDFLNKKAEKAPDTVSYVHHYQQQRPADTSTSKNIATNLRHKPVITVITQTPKIETRQTPQQEFTEKRYQTILPAAKEAVEAVKPEPVIIETPQIKEKAAEVKAEPVIKQQLTQIYTVLPGDSLAKIAKNFYGEEAGNKLSSIEKIYNANKDKLKSIDELYVGQKLLIPPLDKKTTAAVKTEEPQGNFRLYIVKDSDSLWRIAEEHLGAGERYHEIIKLNKSILKDPDALAVGMKLKLPKR
ncbi:MAG: LysM peptidoglycan-binding domain-containing protein [Sedimentisphaerales bacterium]|nr:LysM peptidoglycan-binding domain-containing protein [Sedimentisphaerales bacterium]